MAETWDFDFQISTADQQTFRHLSGDHNALHYDRDFARSAKFDGPVVYGALIVAKISGFIGSVFPGRGAVWASLRIDFREPLYVDQPATLHVEESHESDLGVWVLSLTVLSRSRKIASGSIQVTRRGASA